MTLQLAFGPDFSLAKFNDQVTEQCGPAVEHSGYRMNLLFRFYGERAQMLRDLPHAPGVYLQCERVSVEPVKSWNVEIECLNWRSGESYSFNEKCKEQPMDQRIFMSSASLDNPNELQIVGIEEDKLINDFASPQDHTNAVLVVEEKEFHVSKESLASYSSFFKALFIPITDQFRYTLDNATAEEFQAFLEVLYHFAGFNRYNIRSVITLSQRFGASSLLKMALNAVGKMRDSQFPLKARVQLADALGLEELIGNTLRSLGTIPDIQRAVPDDLQQLKPETRLILLEKMKNVNLLK